MNFLNKAFKTYNLACFILFYLLHSLGYVLVLKLSLSLYKVYSILTMVCLDRKYLHSLILIHLIYPKDLNYNKLVYSSFTNYFNFILVLKLLHNKTNK